MKKIFLTFGLILMTVSMTSQNKNAKAQIEVDGVCGMCKQRIEKAALNTKGVKSAVWSVETHMLSLILDERKTDLKTIHQNIAAVGHDTEQMECTKEAYDGLHPCCKYKEEEVIDDHKKKDDDK
jgi:copper chaperone CopZ